MTKRRDTLQRISRIDSIYTAQDMMAAEIPCGHFVGMMTIEAVLDLYMAEISSPIIINFCLLPEQYREARADGKGSVAFLDGDKAGVTSLDGREGASLLSGGYEDAAAAEPDGGGEAPRAEVYDLLDANRGSGFLFYSYDKHGIHCILGEQRAGGYGDYI